MGTKILVTHILSVQRLAKPNKKTNLTRLASDPFEEIRNIENHETSDYFLITGCSNITLVFYFLFDNDEKDPH